MPEPEDSLERPSPGDHTLRVTKAVLATVPFGGGIASLLTDYVPESRDRARDKLLGELANKLRQMENRLDGRLLTQDEFKSQFAEIFDCTLVIAMRSRQDEKLRGAAALLVNLLLHENDPAKMPFTEVDHFVRCLDFLSLGAIQVVGVAHKIAQGKRRAGSEAESVRVDFGELTARLPETDPHLLMGLVGELGAMNLFHLLGSPSVRTADYGNYPIEVTPLGFRFVEHVLSNE